MKNVNFSSALRDIKRHVLSHFMSKAVLHIVKFVHRINDKM